MNIVVHVNKHGIRGIVPLSTIEMRNLSLDFFLSSLRMV
jgi:hypothetical protein